MLWKLLGKIMASMQALGDSGRIVEGSVRNHVRVSMSDFFTEGSTVLN